LFGWAFSYAQQTGIVANMARTFGPHLRDIPFLKEAPSHVLKSIERECAWFCIAAGEILIEEDSSPSGLYFVLSGSLGAFRKTPDGRSEFLGHIRAGEPVGEMALLAGERHVNAVYAMRDTEVVRISRAGFLRLIHSSPETLERLTRIILIRLRQNKKPLGRNQPKVFALIATSPTIDLRIRSEAIAKALERSGRSVAIVGSEAGEQPMAFFDELEAKNDIVLITAVVGDTLWFRQTMRQADRLWILARGDARPSVPLLPEDTSPARMFRLVDVIVLHHGAERRASRPSEWRAAADATRVFQWSGVEGPDCERLARVISGESVGLVLAGGGARAYAHIGVIRAMREFSMPIDFIGGASMGAVIAACVAKGWSQEEMEDRIRQAFVSSDPLGDYNLPVVGLVKGVRVRERLKHHFGEDDIEDLTLPFYAVSTNLTDGTLRIHQSGLLREALRASISLPGILPPVVLGGKVLVDGAVLNNFPVDVMRELQRGYVIGCDVAQDQALDPHDFIDPPGFFSWVARHGMSSAPPIASLLMRSATVSVDHKRGRDNTDLLILPEMPNIDLRDWKSYDQAIEAGYRAAKAVLLTANDEVSHHIKRKPAL
jgi:NTE family protein